MTWFIVRSLLMSGKESANLDVKQKYSNLDNVIYERLTKKTPVMRWSALSKIVECLWFFQSDSIEYGDSTKVAREVKISSEFVNIFDKKVDEIELVFDFCSR